MARKTAKKKTMRKKATTRKKKTTHKKATTRKRKATRKKSTTRKKKKTAASGKRPAPKAPARKTPSGGSGTTSSAGTPPAAGKTGLRIRMYRVGFGDFFLMSLPVPAGPLHVLIDCGVHAVNLGSIGDALDDMNTVTGGNLALVIMTHRHADHISGFASGADIFKNFTVERVWMSWFENPNNPAAVRFQSTLAAVATNLQATLAPRTGADDQQYKYMVENITGDAAAAPGAPTSNQAALNVLHGGFKSPQPPIDYYQAGDAAILPDSLTKAGLTAKILGPPIDPKLVAQMNGKGEQYLAANDATGAPPARIAQIYETTANAYPPEAFALLSPAEIASTVAASLDQTDLMAAQASQADNTLNNQSLVILFSFGGKTLLFAGDAQWGNWQNFLYGGAVGSGTVALDAEAEQILGSIDFYKVGHHGSTNATPIDALKAMREDCIAMCSTQPGAYGKIANKSEVPRIPLVAAIDTKTANQLARTDMVNVDMNATLAAKIAKFEQQNAPGDLPSIFQAGPNDKLYIDLDL